MKSFHSTLETEIGVTEKLKYLALECRFNTNSHLSPELFTKNLPTVAGHLDLALPTTTIAVAKGSVKYFNKAILKAKGPCGEFVLFSNLPMEIQSEIFRLCTEQEGPRVITFVETNENGCGWFRQIGARRPPIFAASKFAMTEAVSRKSYVAMFATHWTQRKVYFRVGHDVVNIDFRRLIIHGPPEMKLAEALRDKADIKAIQLLHLHYGQLIHFTQWSMQNITLLPNIKELHVSGAFVDPGRAHSSACVFTLKDITGGRLMFASICVTPGGQEVRGDQALITFQSYICHPAEKFRINDLRRFMHMGLDNVRNFPTHIVFMPTYFPAPGFPLAAVQPVIQFP